MKEVKIAEETVCTEVAVNAVNAEGALKYLEANEPFSDNTSAQQLS